MYWYKRDLYLRKQHVSNACAVKLTINDKHTCELSATCAHGKQAPAAGCRTCRILQFAGALAFVGALPVAGVVAVVERAVQVGFTHTMSWVPFFCPFRAFIMTGQLQAGQQGGGTQAFSLPLRRPAMGPAACEATGGEVDLITASSRFKFVCVH